MEQGIVKKIEQSRDEEIKKIGAIELTEQFKVKFADNFDKVKTFLERLDIPFDVSNLRIYVDYSNYIKMEAEQFEDAILLTKKFFDKNKIGKDFSFVHELVHCLARKPGIQVGNKVHERSGYALNHLSGNVEIMNDFFIELNEGMTEWITALIFGNVNEIGSYKKQYELIVYLVDRVSSVMSQDDIIRDYFSNGTKFLHAIKDEYGKGAIKILSTMSSNNIEEVLEFFMTDNESQRAVMRDELLDDK